MAEWLHEAGIGEDRAILVEDGAILEAAIELPGRLRAGTVAQGRLDTIMLPARRAMVALDGGGEALLEPLPAGLAEGRRVTVEIVREPIPERGRPKLARCRITRAPVGPGPPLLERLRASGLPVSTLDASGNDRFEEAGWSELLEQAQTGDISFPGGALRMSLTPAMTLFDVDGALDPAALAVAGARASASAIRRLGIGGSIGIDLPTLGARADRQAAAAALDAVLPQPFERTAVNGFGFLHVVRRRERPSLPEVLREDPVGAAARALLRAAERAPGAGERMLHASPEVVERLRSDPGWIELLARRVGAPVALSADPAIGLGGGYVSCAFP